ncbi:BRO1 domain-containing protein BROX-like [Ruditapes philippinarum]|uniref:BRO1 domain-containing protein BROX-like n=2 Tax=Ruditapes philippinarum TaxID=129788 RepID=UPI00295B935B|nr:BRO1 domain-containing protein BROX-like [Ruditapes philippinarum]
MAYWFHRNPLKATSPVTFELAGVSTNEATRKIFSDMRIHRNKLLELLTDPNHDKGTLEKTANDYFSLLIGLVRPFEEGETENKLRTAVKFRWTNTLLGNTPIEKQDAVFELASMAVNVALWYTKHSAKWAAKDEVDMEEAKEVHKCLRTAGGIFNYVKTELVPKLTDNTENATDTDSRVLDAYINQCTAEAQEVTLARAIELKHSASLIAALANETGQLYRRADDALASLDDKIVGKWRKYFQLKSDFYIAHAHCYNAEGLLAQDKCGEAIRGLQEGITCYDKAAVICKDYSTTKGPGTQAKPLNHIFFRRLGPVMKRTLDKCERENGLIYHQKVAYDPPILELKATFGLVSPEEFKPADLSPLWSVDVYKKMDSKMVPKPGPQLPGQKEDKDKEKPKELPPVKEKEFPMSDKDPKNNSGCILS